MVASAQAAPSWQGHAALYDSLGNIHPRMRPRWLYERGVDLDGLFRPSAKDSGPLRLRGKWGRGPSFEVTGQDTLVFLSLGSEVAILNFANPDSPRVVSEVQASGIVAQAAVRDSLLFIGVTTGAPGLEVWNVSVPATPVLRGTVSTRLSDFCLMDSLAFVTQRSFPSYDTFKVYDVSDPESIRLIGACRDSGNVVTVAGDLAVLGDERDLHVIDVSDPTQPERVGSYGGWAMSVAARNSICCATFGNPNQPGDLTFRVLDLSDPAAVWPLATLTSTGGKDMHLADSLVFISGHYSGTNPFKILSISDSTQPHLLGAVETPGWREGVWVNRAAARAYVADNWEGLRPIDITSLTSPVLDSAVLAADQASDIYVDGNTMYVAGDLSGLHIVDVSDPTRPTSLGNFDTLGMNPTMNAVVVRDSFAYVGWQFPRFRTVSVADPEHPEGAGACWIFNPPEDMVLRDSLVYIAEVARLQIVNVARPREPVLVGSCNLEDDAAGMWLQDTLAYVAYYPVSIINVADPADPHLIGEIRQGCSNVVVEDTVAFISSGLLTWYSVADPTSPYAIDSINLGHTARGLAVVDTVVYATSLGNLYAVNVVDLHQPRVVGTGALPYDAKRIAYAEPYLYVACWDAGVCVFETVAVGVAEPKGGVSPCGGLRIAPNPTAGCVEILAPGVSTGYVMVRDIAGRVLQQEAARVSAEGGVMVDIRGLQAGVYFVEVKSGGVQYRGKLVRR